MCQGNHLHQFECCWNSRNFLISERNPRVGKMTLWMVVFKLRELYSLAMMIVAEIETSEVGILQYCGMNHSYLFAKDT
jgi:hypothetical protein